MAVQVRFYSYAKRKNSTAQPTGSGTAYNCVFVEPCDYMHPQIKLNLGPTGDPLSYNLASIPSLQNRRYFIRSWTWSDGLWIAQLDVDALGTWKSSLGRQSSYVYRSSYSWDGKIRDTLYPMTAKTHKLNVSLPKLWTVNGANEAGAAENTGLILAQIISNRTTLTYAFSVADFSNFLQRIFSDEFYDAVLGEFGANSYPEAKVAINPLQYISNVWYVPVGLIDSGYWGIRHDAAVTSLYVGCVSVPVAGQAGFGSAYPVRVSTSIYDVQIDASDFVHPQADDRGDWLNMSPYTDYEVFYPPFGLFALDPAALLGKTHLRFRVLLSPATAQIMLDVAAYDLPADERTIFRATASFGVNIPLSNIVVPGASEVRLALAASEAIAGTVGLAMGNPGGASGVVGGAASAIGEIVKGNIPHLSTMGGTGSLAGMDGYPKLYVTHWYLADDDLAGRGRPLCKTRQINAIPGYIQCDGEEIKLACTSEELELIKGFCNSGFFYE